MDIGSLFKGRAITLAIPEVLLIIKVYGEYLFTFILEPVIIRPIGASAAITC